MRPGIRKDFARRTRLKYRQAGCQRDIRVLAADPAIRHRRRSSDGEQPGENACTVPVLEETTYPYLDQNLIEFVLSTPAEQWLRPGERRSLMRRALAGIVPAEILSRKTKQFAARTPAVMLDQHWGEIQAAYVPRSAQVLGMWTTTELLKIVGDIRAGKTVPLVRVLWTISLEFWLRDLAQRGLLELPAFSELAPTRRRDAVHADRDPNNLPPVHSGRNISTKENHHDVQQTRS